MSETSADDPATVLPLSYEELIAQHKKQQKDLIATITSLKKQATKKTRKNVNAKCADLQRDLDDKQQQELKQLQSTGESEESTEVTPEQLLALLTIEPQSSQLTEDHEPSSEEKQPQQVPKKRNRQKERLAKRNAEIEKIKSDARKEAENAVDYKKIEQDSMNQILFLQNLKVHDIRPDGHCLFASIEDQLKERHDTDEEDVTIASLREAAAKYINDNRDDFLPFFFDPETMQQTDVDKYLHELQTTAMWGSDIEIKALASVFDCPIKVYSAGAAPITFNEQGANPELKLGYFRYSYGLGEHYNSLRSVE